MSVSARLSGVLDWLREGYPAGIPPTDYVPLLALLRRRLSEDEVREVAEEIVRLTPPGDATDIGVSITKITDALPSEAELARVERHLTEHHGCPMG
jgi:predicted HAD superfamily phosphohydrolase